MKAKLIILLIISIICFVNTSKGQWVQTNGPYGSGRVNCFASNGGIIYAGTWGSGLYKSVNNGLNWNLIGFAGEYISAIAVNGNNIYVGINYNIFHSINNGIIWDTLSMNFPGVNSIITNGNNIYTATSQGIYLSTDNGITWDTIGLNNKTVNKLAISNNNIYAVTNWSGIYYSIDNGQTWIPKNLNSSYNNVISILVIDTIIFVGTDCGIFSSSLNSNYWNQLNVVTLSGGCRVPSIVLKNNLIFIAVKGNGVYISSDYGNSWVASNTGLDNKITNAIFSNDSCVLVGTDFNGVYSYDLNNHFWQETNNGMVTSNLIGLYNNNNDIIGVTSDLNSGSIYKTSNTGNNWLKINSGLPLNFQVKTVTKSSNKIFAGTLGKGVYCSADNGNNWYPSNGGLSDTFINVLAANGNNIYAGTNSGIFLSTNEGYTWTKKNNGLSEFCVNAITILGNNVYAGLFASQSNNMWHGGVYSSTDNCNNWSFNGLYGNSIQSFSIIDSIIIAYVYGGISFSSDFGNSWININTSSVSYINCIAVYGSIIFAGTDYNGVFMTTDMGTTWSSINTSLLYKDIQTLAVNNGYLYAGTTQGGVWKRPLSEIIGINETANPATNLKVFPNPFSKSTTFTYTLKENHKVNLNIYDITGRIVKQLVNETQIQGEHTLTYDAGNLQAGIYYYRLQAGDEVNTGKLILSK